MRVFLDANVLFSAAKSNGAVREFLGLLLDAGHECWVDHYVVSEARRNLGAKDPETLPVLETLLARFRICPVQVPGRAPADVTWLPERTGPCLRPRSVCVVTHSSPATTSTSGRLRQGVRRCHDPLAAILG